MNRPLLTAFFTPKKDEKQYPNGDKWWCMKLILNSTPININNRTFYEIAPLWFVTQLAENKSVPSFHLVDSADLTFTPAILKK